MTVGLRLGSKFEQERNQLKWVSRWGVWLSSACKSSLPELRGLPQDAMKWEKVFRETWGLREPNQNSKET